MLGGGGFCDQRERRHMQDTHAHVKSTHFPRNPDPAKGNGLWYHTGEASKEEKVTWTNRYYERESEVVFFSPTTPPPLFLPTTTTITTCYPHYHTLLPLCRYGVRCAMYAHNA